MSVLFPKLNKPREWDYRPIYYDPEKEERKRKLEMLHTMQEQQKQSVADDELKTEEASSAAPKKEPYVPTLHRGSFREARNAQGQPPQDRLRKTSRLTFWLVLLALLAVAYYICQMFVA